MARQYWAHVAFVIVLLGLLLASFFMLTPFLSAIAFALLLAYIFHPIQVWLTKKWNWPTINALIVSFLVIALVIGAMGFIASSLVSELNYIYQEYGTELSSGSFADDCSNETNIYCSVKEALGTVVDDDKIERYGTQAANGILSFISGTARRIVFGFPLFLLNVAIMLFVMFYAIRDGSSWVQSVKKAIPMINKHKNEIFERTDATLSALLYAQLLVSLFQGFLAGLGFWFFGVPNPVFWGVIMAVLSVIPVIGSWLVWIPASVQMFVQGYIADETGLIVNAIALAVYCAVVVGLADNLGRPFVASERANVHPMVVFIGTFGGVAAFGITGFILGPLLLAMTVVLVSIYIRESPHKHR
ncbi:AI-2E family transporter [Candidatus Woesearchaeota archaeon]|nr:AI-2E family transporter [Candidatus Woesearchaeota archaeon]